MNARFREEVRDGGTAGTFVHLAEAAIRRYQGLR
jgi:hypothetical protein